MLCQLDSHCNVSLVIHLDMLLRQLQIELVWVDDITLVQNIVNLLIYTLSSYVSTS